MKNSQEYFDFLKFTISELKLKEKQDKELKKKLREEKLIQAVQKDYPFFKEEELEVASETTVRLKRFPSSLLHFQISVASVVAIYTENDIRWSPGDLQAAIIDLAMKGEIADDLSFN